MQVAHAKYMTNKLVKCFEKLKVESEKLINSMCLILI